MPQLVCQQASSKARFANDGSVYSGVPNAPRTYAASSVWLGVTILVARSQTTDLGIGGSIAFGVASWIAMMLRARTRIVVSSEDIQIRRWGFGASEVIHFEHLRAVEVVDSAPTARVGLVLADNRIVALGPFDAFTFPLARRKLGRVAEAIRSKLDEACAGPKDHA